MDLLGSSSGNTSPGLKKSKSALYLFFRWIVEYRYLFVFSVLGSLVLAYLVNKFTVPTYLVKTSLLIKEKGGTNNPEDLLYKESGQAPREKSEIREEVALLQTNSFIRRTLDSLNLRVAYYTTENLRKAELYNNAPFQVLMQNLSAVEKLAGSRFLINFKDDQHFELSNLETSGRSSFSKTYAIGDTAYLQKCPVVVVKTSLFRFPNDVGRDFEFVFFDMNALAMDFRNRLNIRTNITEGSIVDVYLETELPQRGIDFLNEFTKQYINYKYEEKSRAVKQRLTFIDDQLALIGQSLKSTESSLVNFKTSSSYTDASKMSDRSIAELSQLEKDRAILQLNEKYYTSLANNLSIKGESRVLPPSSVGINDGATESMVQQLSELQLEKNGYAAGAASENPLLKESRFKNDQKITALKNTLLGNVKTILVNNRIKQSQINNASSQHQSKVNSLPNEERKFVDIKRDNDLNEQMYLFLSQKKVEAGILQAATTIESKVIETAALESAVPLRPKKKNNYALALFLGIGVPFCYVFLKKVSNKKITGKEEYETLCSIPVVGTIFHYSGSDPVAITPNARTAISESFRLLRSSLLTIAGKRDATVILITSMEKGAGKSLCSLNIACSLALLKKKTVLINLDLRLRNQLFHKYEKSLGISSYLDDLASIKDIIVETDQPYLSYIAAGEWPINASELIADEKLAPLFDYLRDNFQYIIVDTPPVGIIADPLIVSRYAHLNVIVVRRQHTKKEKLLELEEMQVHNKIKNPVVLLNDEKLEGENAKSHYYIHEAPERRSRLLARFPRLFE